MGTAEGFKLRASMAAVSTTLVACYRPAGAWTGSRSCQLGCTHRCALQSCI